MAKIATKRTPANRSRSKSTAKTAAEPERRLSRRSRPRETQIENAFETLATMHSEYDAAKEGRYRRKLRGIAPGGSHADFHVRSDVHLLKMIERARWLDRDDPVVGQGLTRLVDNVFQDGFTLDPTTGDDDLNATLSARWKKWSENAETCDIAGEYTLDELSRLAFRAHLVDGDILFVGSSRGSLETIEAHRLRTPGNTKRDVVHGVRLDASRRRLAYWITKEDVDPNQALRRVLDVRQVPARDPSNGGKWCFHIFSPKRISQTRGVTAFAPIIDQCGMHSDLQFSKMVQSVIVSCFAIIRSRNSDFSISDGAPLGAVSTDTLADGMTRTMQGIGPGMEISGEVGEDISGFSPRVPNPEFFKHALMILQIIAVNLGLPLQVFLLDAKQTNFSGWRGAIDQARYGFRAMQRNMIRKFFSPIYLWKVREWLAKDEQLRTDADAVERDGGSIFTHRFAAPRWRYIEPQKDARADELILKAHLTSPRRLHRERTGAEWTEVAQEIVDDASVIVTKSIEVADKINASNPNALVDWREIAGFSLKGKPNAAPALGRPLDDPAKQDVET